MGYIKEMSGSKRRSYLGIGVTNWDSSKLGTIEMVGTEKIPVVVDSIYVGTGKISGDFSDSNLVWKLLRRSKQLLSMRTPLPELMEKLDLRREWNLERSVKTVLDLYPSVKYSYSSLRGKRMGETVDIVGGGGKVRVADIARSHSIRLDPVDSPKELFKYRQRIQRIIEWAYATDLVPIMVTLTLYHRWNDLVPLVKVLGKAWSGLFRGTPGMQRKNYIGLRGYIRRMEETFNDADEEFDISCNAGWHPHYHAILLIPRDKLQVVSDYEETLRNVWVELVRKYYVEEFGEEIPASYYSAFKEHGLVFSRYKSVEHARRCGNRNGKAGDLLEVKDGKYLAKLMGTDAPLYGGDNELTASLEKNSKTPFELLRSEVTANLADLWCEYAIATKKIPCFTFSHGLQKEVDTYFASNDGIVPVSLGDGLAKEELVVRLWSKDYRWLYKHDLLGSLFDKAKQGFDVVKSWLKESFNIEVVDSFVEFDGTVEDYFESVAVESVSDVDCGGLLESDGSNLVSDALEVVANDSSIDNAGACRLVADTIMLGRAVAPKTRARHYICFVPLFDMPDTLSLCGKNNKSPPNEQGRNKSPPLWNKSPPELRKEEYL